MRIDNTSYEVSEIFHKHYDDTKPRINSDTFGSWINVCNGFQQHNISAKEFMSESGYRKHFDVPKQFLAPSKADRKRQLDALLKTECWYSADGKYKVAKVDAEQGDYNAVVHMPDITITWLSIRMLNNDHLCDWREFQEIKNDLCGKEREAIEIYPSESRLVDEANTFHLWVLPEGMSSPFGWKGIRSIDTRKGNRKRKETK